MEQDLHQYVRSALLAMKPRWPAWKRLQETSGVPASTISKYAYGVVTRPSYDTLKRIADAVKGAQ